MVILDPIKLTVKTTSDIAVAKEAALLLMNEETGSRQINCFREISTLINT